MSVEAKHVHTPGPWQIMSNGTTRKPFLILAANDAIVTQLQADPLVMDDIDAEPLANARLIAAAPEMLEALEAANAELVDLYAAMSNSQRERVSIAAIERVQAVLRKAKGEL